MKIMSIIGLVLFSILILTKYPVGAGLIGGVIGLIFSIIGIVMTRKNKKQDFPTSALRPMSIFGVVLYSMITLIYFSAFSTYDPEIYSFILSSAATWGLLGCTYGLIFSSFGIAETRRKIIRTLSTEKLLELKNLHDNNLLTEEEFQELRDSILKKL